ncbi:MAG: molybdopterin molybdenumtransferase MoeA, partial [Deltaproteobacteria bacterium]|nr:molybdopterin molybdenumtransferase MoeA [Deltaproteobacteria bacterium]
MKIFFKVKTVEEVQDIINSFQPLDAEDVPLTGANGRVLAEPAASGEDIPQFDRSTMDGYAVRAKDTFGATEGLPALFEVVGEVLMGEQAGIEIGPGRTARVWTGGMIPKGADAVVMIEHARAVDEHTVELAKAVAPYDHIIRIGEDVRTGQTLLAAGHRLRPQDVGLLAALGHNSLRVHKIPRVAIISTGDEIVPTEARLKIGQV